jgi:GntR family transcriptional regulator, transcriptional repressor for pyruvate dehydrogenase complex
MSQEGLFRTVGSRGRLVDRVVDEVQTLIVGGQLPAGTRLPAEMGLAARFAVSRTVIREAVRILVAKGLLETRPGVGTTVRQVTRDQVVEPLSMLLQVHKGSIDHLHQVRSILEVAIAGLAAAQATPEDIIELRQIVTDQAMVGNEPTEFAAKDADFHRGLANTTHNPLLSILLDSIRDMMQEIRLRVSSRPDFNPLIVHDHQRILDCVAAKDADGARRAMQEHIERARAFQEQVFVVAQQ